ncbi:YkvA family protein [Paenibacillus sp. N3.4]|uniref:YkvA family protein n=1 Tax=Paenibacillus sp. N3.4 TaxID=2603222 RepID=UPI0011CB1E88|nr:YkvA family protein [Paenibacillus sp. N3.4]TXK76086.1 DUF1232 domain-containing protein [Paenibacillus sp. N3.4]
MNTTKYEKYFSTDGFWSKLTKGAKKAGSKVIYTGLLLFYALDSPKTPLKAKVQIYGALGYLILPFDVIPDFLPIIGYVDDFSVLGLALVAVAKSIDDDVKMKAKKKLQDLFGANGVSSRDILDIDGQLLVKKNESLKVELEKK